MGKRKTLANRHDDDVISELIGPVCMLAEMSTASETPGVAADDEMDTLIMAARRIKEREGFAVHIMSLADHTR